MQSAPAPTPAKVNCAVSIWSDYSACAAPQCGENIYKARQRVVTTQPANGGAACPSPLIEHALCVPPEIRASCDETTAASTTTTTTATTTAGVSLFVCQILREIKIRERKYFERQNEKMKNEKNTRNKI